MLDPRPIRACIALAWILVTSLAAQAGVSVEADATQPSLGVLVGRTPGGAIDPRFGTNGRAPVVGMLPRSVSTDSLGRLLVVGTSRAAPSLPMLQRYTANGHLDNAYGEGGSSVGAPVSAAASALDALVLGDGRTLVLGQLDDTGVPRPALWFVDVGGRFEPNWLQWTDTDSAAARSLTLADGGAVMVSLAVPRPPAGTLEAFILVPARGASAVPERLVQNPYPKAWGYGARLERGDKRQWQWVDPARSDLTPLRAVASTESDDSPLWTWRKGALLAKPGAAASHPAPAIDAQAAAASVGDAGGAIFIPFTQQGPPLVVTRGGDAQAGDESNVGAVGWSVTGLLMAGLVLVFLWRRRT